MMDSYEDNIAMLEANRVDAEDAYFKARPQIDCNDRRIVFEAGYDRAWQARDAEIATLRQQLAERDALIAKKDEALCSAFETVKELTKDKNNSMALCVQVTKLQEALALKPKELG